MNLQEHDLTLNSQGENVRSLQDDLRQLGFLDTSPNSVAHNEWKRSFLGEETLKALINFQLEYNLQPLKTAVDKSLAQTITEKADATRTFIVKGQVKWFYGSPASGYIVRAYDKDLRNEQDLGQALTDAQGYYQIAYKADQFRRTEKKRADLFVRVFDANETFQVVSPTRFNAELIEPIDLTVGGKEYRGPSEYERYLETLLPLLEGVSLADLREDDEDDANKGKFQDISFLAAETGIEPERIAFLVIATQFNNETKLEAPIFYGFFRQNLPTNLPALLAQSPDIQRTKLEAALAENIIPAYLQSQIDTILQRLKALIVEEAVKEPTTPEKPSLGALLSTASLDATQQTEFLTAYVNHEGAIEDFWQQMRENPNLNQHVDQLQFTLQLGALTANHLPLVQELQQMQRQQEISSLQDLARFNVDNWLDLINRQNGDGIVGFPPDIPGKDSAEQATNYAKAMTRMVEDAFPTAFIAHQIDKEDSAGLGDLRSFFAQTVLNPEKQDKFDIRTTYLEQYLLQNPEVLNNIADPAALKDQIQGMQRLYKIIPQYAAIRPLQQDGIESAYTMTQIPANRFIDQYQNVLGGTHQARAAYDRAQQTVATSMTLFAEYSLAFNRTSMHVLSDNLPKRVAGVADWESMFGSLDFCACEHCNSVYSPAAYLVDILHFLNKRQLMDQQRTKRDANGNIIKPIIYQTLAGTTTIKTAKDVLFERRPDIGNIALTCKNINTLIPYVDLVNEVLENAISPDTATASIDQQTHNTADELKANPEYLNAGAYDELREAVYPWSLPFDLFLEEVRAYLNHLGVSRSELMATFLKVAEPFDPTDANAIAIASESLGLSPVERQIITGTLSGEGINDWNYWGLQQSNNILPALDTRPTVNSPENHVQEDWLTALRRVRLFLDRSELSYAALLDLLQTHFINPLQPESTNRQIQIQAIRNWFNPDNKQQPLEEVDSTTCDTTKLILTSLNADILDRIHRFIRLWRKLGWTMPELDQAITALNPTHPSLDDAFLVKLSQVQHLHQALDTPIPTLLAWWSAIDRTSYTDYHTSGAPQIPSLYNQLFRNKAVTNPIDPGFEEIPLSSPNLLNNPNFEDEGPNGRSTTFTGIGASGNSAADHWVLWTTSPGNNQPAAIQTELLPSTAPGGGTMIRVNTNSGGGLVQVFLPMGEDLEHAIASALVFVKRGRIAIGIGNGGNTRAEHFSSTTNVWEVIEAPNRVSPANQLIIYTASEGGAEFYVAQVAVNAGQKLSTHAATLTAALGISAEDLSRLVNDSNVISRSVPAANKPNDTLNLDNLSRLYRYVTLAKALGLSIRDCLSVRRLTGHDPFTSPLNTITFVEAVETIRSSGFSVEELNYLLRHESVATSSVALTEESIALILNEIRAELQKIASENTYTDDIADPIGDLTKTKLALLKWDNALIEEAIALLNTSPHHEVKLDALPTGTTFANDVKNKVTYDAATHTLRFTGIMTEDERTSLLNAVSDRSQPLYTAYETAVRDLFTKSRNGIEDRRTFIEKRMRAYEIPTFAVTPQFLVALPSLPAGLAFPRELADQISYNSAATNQLQFIGIMTLAQKNKLLALAPGEPDYQTAINALYEELVFPSDFPKQLKDKLYYDATEKVLRFSGWMTDAEKQQLLALIGQLNKPSVIVGYQNAISSLFNAALDYRTEAHNQFLTEDDFKPLFESVQSTGDRFKLVLKKLLNHLRKSLSETLVKQKLSEAFKLDARITEELLTRRVTSPEDSSRVAIAEFLDDSFVQSHPTVKLTASAFPNPFKTFVLLQKIATIITKFKVTPKQLTWLFDYATEPEIGWLNLQSLPLAPTDSLSIQFNAWKRLVDLFQLRDALPFGETTLSRIFSLARDRATSSDVLLWELSDRTQWNLEDLKHLTGSEGFNFVALENYRDERILVCLQSCFTTLKRLGASANQCYNWTKSEVSQEDPRSLKQIVKAKYEESQWLALAKPLRDILREKQRSALVSYLVTHPDSVKQQTWKDANSLYEHFLIDVEMSPCQMTSRIKQAISSVQLFVQRCLMNLERAIVADANVDENWQQWKWMKNYRVWEANRKVFLYPENWVEPELRDDKSPFFKELENELLQNELTMDTAETAFLHYLEKLDAVARLEIMGMYHQLETEDGTATGNKTVDILHVFGRTRAIPHVYYYRQRVNSAYWTAWEKVDVDIEGDHLIPVIWNRRLYLFWAVFIEKQAQTPVIMPAPNQPLNEGQRYWIIQLAWSEYKNKTWSAKKIADERLSCLDLLPAWQFAEKKLYSFKTQITNNQDLIIHLNLNHNLGTNFAFPAGKFRFAGCHGTTEIKVYTLRDQFVPEHTRILYPTGTRLHNMVFIERQEGELGYDSNRLRLLEGNFRLAESISDDLNLLSAWTAIPTLNKTLGTFQLAIPHQYLYYQFVASQVPFFYQDDTRTFFVTPKVVQIPLWAKQNQVRPDQIVLTHFYYLGLLQTSTLNNLQPNSLDHLPLQSSTSTESTFDQAVVTPSVKIRQSNASNLTNNSELTGSLVTAIQNQSFTGSFTIPLFRPENRYRFQNFYHPYVCHFIKELNQNGIDGLLQRSIQQSLHNREFFVRNYEPTESVDLLYPIEDVDFLLSSAYSLYNWEVFFHIPLIIADRLSKNQRFEEAHKWFHYIFDPTDTSGFNAPQRYWRTKPFFETTTSEYREQQIQVFLRLLASLSAKETQGQLPHTDREKLKELKNKVDEWRKNPFKPHLVARMRTTAYQKTVVMKYIDNLIAWGDQLFRRDTIESINEATQLYILAAEILGRRPEKIQPRSVPEIQTYNTLEPSLDRFSNTLVKSNILSKIEDLIPALGENGTLPATTHPQLTLPMLYFCIPENDKLLGYWDTVADRLFKIRHCMNIEGTVRQLLLFEPPIDPALLVKATAAGIDISSALNDINAALPHYRFNIMMQKASELCAELKSLGAALLSALEKRDAEALALMRSTHEINVLNAVRLVREKQVKEAEETLESLRKSRELATIRESYYATLLSGISSISIGIQAGSINESISISLSPMNEFELAQLELIAASLLLQAGHVGAELTAGVLHLIPNAKVGVPTTVGVTYGGANVASAIQAFGSSLSTIASMLNTAGSAAATLGSYKRRADEWRFQKDLAVTEGEHIEKQIAAAEIRKQIVKQELINHDLQIENAKAVDVYMRDKFTNQELYDWMSGQISSLYFQSYQLAYDIAKRAERAYRYELGLNDSNFIQFGYWDSLKKGLLAGERLHQDLKRMELAYLEQNKREYEITKHISLLTLDPIALIQLKQNGECFVNLPEALFDLDHPGHYMRRIKSVSLTIPCVTGAYTSVSCTLTLLKSSIRHSNILLNKKYERLQENDTRFTDRIGAIQSIVTSNAQNDSGLFEPNLRDERYLPFEGAGADSEWRIELPNEFRQFDYNTISDVILHIRYTAREGGELLKNAAIGYLRDYFNGHLREYFSQDGAIPSLRMFSLRQEFPTQWHRFLNPANLADGNIFELEITTNLFLIRDQGKNLKVNTIWLLARCKDSDSGSYTATLTHSAGTNPMTLTPNNQYGGLHVGQPDAVEIKIDPATEPPITWQLQMSRPGGELLQPNEVEDILFILGYEWE